MGRSWAAHATLIEPPYIGHVGLRPKFLQLRSSVIVRLAKQLTRIKTVVSKNRYAEFLISTRVGQEVTP